MAVRDYHRARIACYCAYLAMSAVFVLPSMLFTTFHRMYGISYTLLGTLVALNFCTQLIIDLIFTFFSRHFNIRLTVRVMPLITTAGMLIYALVPMLLPQYAYTGLVLGTVVFSISAGLSEVLLSPMVAAMPSAHPEKDMSILHSLYGWGVVGNVLLASVYFLLFGTENWCFLLLTLAVAPLVVSFLFWTSDLPDVSLSGEQGRRTAGKAKGIALCAVCIFLGSSAENVMTNWVSGYMEVALQLPKELGDILGLAVFALLLAVTRVLYAKFSPNITKTLLVSMAGAVVCYLIAGFSPWVVPAFIACILTGICTSMLWPGTLILMEEKVPSPGVAAYALMAACGDFGASVAPQMMGVVVDRVSVSAFAQSLGGTSGMTPEEIGLKTGMVIASLFPILGTALVLFIQRQYRSGKK